MNRVLLIGRMVRDIELRYTQSAEPLAIGRFTLAVNRRFKKQGEKEEDFINCVAHAAMAENIEKYTAKGHLLFVLGHWGTGSYTNKKGEKVYTNDCIIEEVEFLENRHDKPLNEMNIAGISAEEYAELPFK